MMKTVAHMCGKLHSSTGETLAETLVALLISALSLVMLASAIASSTNMVSTSKESMEDYYDKNNDLSTKPSSGDKVSDGSATITIGGNTISQDVSCYEGETVQGTKVVSYKVKSGG